LEVEVAENLYAGQTAKVKLTCNVEGECTVDLVCRRDRLRQTPPTREYYDGRDRILREYHSVYQMANDPVWCVQTVACRPGDTELEFTVPADARGQGHVRAYVAGARQAALGSADVFVRKPPEQGVSSPNPENQP
jgi:hypothetical protein